MSELAPRPAADTAPDTGAQAAEGFSIDADEVARFSALAAKWWDPKGAFAPLHKFNPTRVRFVRDTAARQFGRDAESRAPFAGLRLLDVGCGGGLMSEPMARLGFNVTGIDASEKNIGTARQHAHETGLDVTYRNQTVEQIEAEGGPLFDVVLSLEVIEHVADPERFLQTCARLVAPGGLLVVATLNRTTKAFALAIVGAEYVLRWLPAGTHDWRKFLKPEEISGFLRDSGLALQGPFGVSYNPLSDQWSLSSDTAINYMMTGTRPPA